MADKAYAAQHPADGPEDRNLGERCFMFSGVGPPMLPEPYNNNYQIAQSPGNVSILAEMNHDVRVIPTDGKVRQSRCQYQWHGISRGRWEGDTLVVETTHIRGIPHHFSQGHFGIIGSHSNMNLWDENLRVTERFTRTDADTLMYRATIDDPTVFTRPWTLEESLRATAGSRCLSMRAMKGTTPWATSSEGRGLQRRILKSKKGKTMQKLLCMILCGAGLLGTVYPRRRTTHFRLSSTEPSR